MAGAVGRRRSADRKAYGVGAASVPIDMLRGGRAVQAKPARLPHAAMML